MAELWWPEGPPSGAPYSYRKEKETHELIFSWLSWLAVLFVGAYARRRRQHSGQTSGMRKWVHFLAAARPFPAQKFKGKHGKHPVSRKIYEKKLKRT